MVGFEYLFFIVNIFTFKKLRKLKFEQAKRLKKESYQTLY